MTRADAGVADGSAPSITAAGVRFIGPDDLAAALPYAVAVDALADAFRQDLTAAPPRQHLGVPRGELLLMPAWAQAGVGVKLVTLNAENPARGLPLIHGLYVLFHPETLAADAVIDGGALTAIRTAAVSALATGHLARPEATRLAVFGAGAQAEAHVHAMRAVRPIARVDIVARAGSIRATELVARLRAQDIDAAVADAASAARAADIVCTCTTSLEPVFAAADLAPGAHVNAIGAYRTDMRELEGDLLARAQVVVETTESALLEAGDVVQAIAEERITAGDLAELAAVVSGAVTRTSPEQTTVFKSVGLGIEDLVLARAAAQRVSG